MPFTEHQHLIYVKHGNMKILLTHKWTWNCLTKSNLFETCFWL